MLSKEENKNLLEGVDYGVGESKSVTNFLATECPKCNHKIKFRLRIGDIKNVEEYIEQLEQENQALKKGQYSLMQSRNKWKIRYYKERKRRKEADKIIEQLIEKLETNLEELEILHDNYIDANVIEGTYETLGRINEIRRILKILKGEKKC